MSINLLEKKLKIEKKLRFIPFKNIRRKILKQYDLDFLNDLYYNCYLSNSLLNKSNKCLLISLNSIDNVIGCGGILSKYSEKFDCLCINGYNKDNYNNFINLVKKLNCLSAIHIAHFLV